VGVPAAFPISTDLGDYQVQDIGYRFRVFPAEDHSGFLGLGQ
jgi:hypothetical protein